MECRMQQGCTGNIETSRESRARGLGIALATAVALALLGGTAQASTVTVGSVLPPGSTPTEFKTVQTMFNTALPEAGANLASPVSGAIVRWRVQGAKGGPFYLRVLHPNGKGAFEATGTSLPATPSGEGLQTFSTNLPIQTGDLIGIDPTNATDQIGIVEVAGSSYATIFPPPFNGSTLAPSTTVAGSQIELSAEVQPTPAITEVTPTFGSVKGGTEVTITGSSLNGASAVKFGTVPAATFKVESDTQITATTPAVSKPGKLDITVTSLAGTSPKVRADTFTYTACVVPGLNGKKLKVAKGRIRDAGCKLGKVKKVDGPARKVGKVVKQSPKAGKILAPGAKVNVQVVKK